MMMIDKQALDLMLHSAPFEMVVIFFAQFAKVG